jgi:hypothetical protein
VKNLIRNILRENDWGTFDRNEDFFEGEIMKDFMDFINTKPNFRSMYSYTGTKRDGWLFWIKKTYPNKESEYVHMSDLGVSDWGGFKVTRRDYNMESFYERVSDEINHYDPHITRFSDRYKFLNEVLGFIEEFTNNQLNESTGGDFDWARNISIHDELDHILEDTGFFVKPYKISEKIGLLKLYRKNKSFVGEWNNIFIRNIGYEETLPEILDDLEEMVKDPYYPENRRKVIEELLKIIREKFDN